MDTLFAYDMEINGLEMKHMNAAGYVEYVHQTLYPKLFQVHVSQGFPSLRTSLL
jgi:hypothetical protein